MTPIGSLSWSTRNVGARGGDDIDLHGRRVGPARRIEIERARLPKPLAGGVELVEIVVDEVARTRIGEGVVKFPLRAERQGVDGAVLGDRSRLPPPAPPPPPHLRPGPASGRHARASRELGVDDLIGLVVGVVAEKTRFDIGPAREPDKAAVDITSDHPLGNRACSDRRIRTPDAGKVDPDAAGEDRSRAVAVGGDTEARSRVQIAREVGSAALEEDGVAGRCAVDGVGDRGQGLGYRAGGAIHPTGRHVPVASSGRRRNQDSEGGQPRNLRSSHTAHPSPPIRYPSVAMSPG